jgi:hypothetical protein
MVLHVFQRGMLNSIDPSQAVANPYGVTGPASACSDFVVLSRSRADLPSRE